MFKTISKLSDLIEKSKEEPFFIFKHGLTCSISFSAKREMENFMKSSKIPVYIMVVQKDRELSLEMQEKLGINHESPQIIFMKDGKPDFVLNHFNIKKEKIEEILKK